MLFGKYINKYYIKYLFYFLVGIIATVVIDLFHLAIPELLGELIDLFTPSDSGLGVEMGYLIELIIKVIVIGFILFVGRMIWRFTLFYASKKVESDLRHDMYLKATRLSSNYYHNNKVGSIMAWFTNDLETIEEFVGWGTLMLVDAIFLTSFALVKMFILSRTLTLLTIIPIILIAITSGLVEKGFGKIWEARQESFDKVYDYSQESFSGIRVIKAFVKEKQQIHHFAKLAKKNKEMNIKYVKVSVLYDSITNVLVNLTLFLILIFGGYLAYTYTTGTPFILFNQEINLTPGNLITYIGYFDTILWPIIALGQVVTMLSRSKASYKRIERFLDAKEEIKNIDNPIVLNDCKGNIEFKNFSFRYPETEKEVLKHINIKINSGEMIGVIGRIGSGKTTLLSSLLRLYNVDNNEVLIDDNDVMNIEIKSLRDQISFVTQENFLFQDSIENNICLGLDKNDDKLVDDALDFADLKTTMDEFDDGKHTLVGERGQTLSGGQKQRISIARAYITDSPILIFDDSVSSVDLKTEKTIINNIKEKRAGKTTILISSRISTVSTLDKVIVLNNGEVEAFDTPENLLVSSSTYKTLSSLQELELEQKGGR